jgi:agarase
LLSQDFGLLDLTRYEVERDDQQFLGEIARRYYGIVGGTMRRYDPNHLIFGEKYLLGDTPAQVIAAAVPYIDALSVQPGDGYIPVYTPGDVYPAREISELYRLTGKPVFICDHQISFPTPVYPHTIWPYHQRRDESEAASATREFLRAAFSDAVVIGYMRCQYIDRFTARRGALKQGLLRHDGMPYERLLEESVRANAEAVRIVRRAIGRN